ncbi:hypothetical protein SFC79_00715 [Nocardioides sp. S-58]|uniref:Lipoprotein n=1 Tax=Nocardioides renjunii TaxID=3095075 RepID=A0ABU5K5N1_9ACTN|nr:hypothetical protein [Nocardioides sp. S-58]MDZ5660269.1 hypothetical protein [Nocardioides sp. S-58]
MTRHHALRAAALAAGLLMVLTGCGGSGTAATGKPTSTVLLGEQVQSLVTQVDEMSIVEWHGQLLTRNPDKRGKRLLDLEARFDPDTGDSAISMESTLDGQPQQVDYLVVAGRAYFNSEGWGPVADKCWAEITGDAARTWALPTAFDPGWPLKAARPIELDGEDVKVTVPFKQVLAGLPRGLFAALPATVPYDTEARGVISPHGPLIEVGVDVLSMWKKLPKDQRATVDTRGAGWWAMTIKESQDDTDIVSPQYVFDPTVTSPNDCKRG